MELEKARREALPGVVAEMVKPAEKIMSINVNHISGGLGGSTGDGSPRPVVAKALDPIMEMAVQLPLLKKIGDQMGVALDDTFTGGKSDRD